MEMADTTSTSTLVMIRLGDDSKVTQDETAGVWRVDAEGDTTLLVGSPDRLRSFAAALTTAADEADHPLIAVPGLGAA